MATILLIEDDENIRLNIHEFLSLAKHNVILAVDGMEGIKMAQSEHPDLIISDITMPYIDGFGVLNILQKEPQTRDIPLIFLSGKNEIDDFRQAMKLGACDYLIKPFEGNDLLDAIEVRLTKSKSSNTTTENQVFHPVLASQTMLEDLLSQCDLVDYKKKQVVFKEGGHPRFVYYIKSGKVKTLKSHEDGKDLVVGLFGLGDFLGYASVLHNVQHVETAEIIEDSELVLIPKKDFEALVNCNPNVMKQFAALLARDFVEKEEQIIGAAYNTLRQKVASALVKLDKKYRVQDEDTYYINISRDDLASIAGTATESLIRTLTDFRQEKLIDINSAGITIINEPRIQKILR